MMAFVFVINFYIMRRTGSGAFALRNLIAIGKDKAGSQTKTCKK